MADDERHFVPANQVTPELITIAYGLSFDYFIDRRMRLEQLSSPDEPAANSTPVVVAMTAAEMRQAASALRRCETQDRAQAELLADHLELQVEGLV